MAAFPSATPTLQVDAQSLLANNATLNGLPNSNGFDLTTYLCAVVGNMLAGMPALSLQSANSSTPIGYATGAGSSVTQATNKTTAFTLNTATGRIIFATGALAGSATTSTATWTCSALSSTDIVTFNQNSGTLGSYAFQCSASSVAGSGIIAITNLTSQSINEVVAVSYAIINGVWN